MQEKAKAEARAVEGIGEGIESCIGKTPLFRIKSLSEATGCEILGKAEVGAGFYMYTLSYHGWSFYWVLFLGFQLYIYLLRGLEG